MLLKCKTGMFCLKIDYNFGVSEHSNAHLVSVKAITALGKALM
jgi:hypothetical protein